jgi:hypothetical protein
MIPPVQQWTSQDQVRPSEVQSSLSNFLTCIGSSTNFCGPRVDWPGLLSTSQLRQNWPKSAGGYLCPESTNKLINIFSRILHCSWCNHSVVEIGFVMYSKIYRYRWMAAGYRSSLTPAVLSHSPCPATRWCNCFRSTHGRMGWSTSLVCKSISFVWYVLGVPWWCLLAVWGWLAFLAVVIASSGRNDVVSGLGFQGSPSHFLSFLIYFGVDKYNPVWTGSDQARPVHDGHSGA